MPRGPRISYPGAIFHVLNRFVDRHPFFRTDKDYSGFLDIYFDVARSFKMRTYAFCLIPNHFHFCLETPTGDISNFLQRFLTRAAQTLNRRHGRTGHLFQGRSKTLLIGDDAHFGTVIGYVLLNGVRAKLSPNALSYKWCSASEMLRKGPCRIDRHHLAEYLSGEDIDPRSEALQIRVLRRWLMSLDIRKNADAFRTDRHGSFMGTQEFRARVLTEKERRRKNENLRGRRKRDLDPKDWSWKDIQGKGAAIVRKWDDKMIRLWRNRQSAVRHVNVFIAHEIARWTYGQIQTADKDRQPLGSYSMIVSRMKAARSRMRQIQIDQIFNFT